MEERYEILGKIGQGGLGSVHRAFDRKLNREVAIKRILTSNEDPTLQEEATNQLMVEAGALASLQHPHIVTVLDVGLDEEGPYVIMELISGKTLDEIIENAPVTWQDFKEIATQSLEALIAAHELNMIHSDLKPPNIMFSWLPSGKFQIKIVDFGLAVLVQNQKQEEIEKMDSVFGSIFFMPPEQFERKTLDARSDLYSLGCCFYQALTGNYPFNGETGTEVVESHLKHDVKPIGERRGDIPIWACQWIMWLINRDRDDRPDSARDALANFLQNDKNTNRASKRPLGASSVDNTTTQVPASNPPAGRWLPFKTHIKIAGAVGWLLLLVLCGVMIKGRNERIMREKTYHRIMTKAGGEGVSQILISGTDLDIVFDIVAKAKPETNLAPALQALAMAYPSDGSDFDSLIVDFATTASLPTTTRKQLFDGVLAKRGGRFAISALLQFAAKSQSSDEATCALNAARSKINDDDAEQLVKIISGTNHPPVSAAAAALLEELVVRTANRSEMALMISNNRMSNPTPAASRELDRLLKICNPSKPQQAYNPPKSTNTATTPPPPKTPASNSQSKPAQAPVSSTKLDPIIEALKGKDSSKQIEAWDALANSESKDAHDVFMKYADEMKDPQVRLHAFAAVIKIASSPETLAKQNDGTGRWKQISWRTKSLDEKKLVIEGLAALKTDWARALIREAARNGAKESQEFAKETLKRLRKAGDISD